MKYLNYMLKSGRVMRISAVFKSGKAKKSLMLEGKRVSIEKIAKIKKLNQKLTRQAQKMNAVAREMGINQKLGEGGIGIFSSNTFTKYDLKSVKKQLKRRQPQTEAFAENLVKAYEITDTKNIKDNLTQAYNQYPEERKRLSKYLKWSQKDINISARKKAIDKINRYVISKK